ncbi:hypothetical protein RHMOL_Rhmol10G0135100 [Rhododendron molle]|uniref:Uncharacterized protein n=1 Tax=Rhododendron molle TaxID=49168 RepID=A0ACC0M1K6_RHOML|nr:hypothetical protein RHMOL_Rhmol10G0135100 [Rhododendron molle]
MWGLDLLKQRIARQLGDGETITAFDHQWISECDNPYRRMGCPVGINNFKLKDLVDWERMEWRKFLLDVLFPKEVVSKIMAIHIPMVKGIDEVYWWGTNKDGKFSLRSAYSGCVFQGAIEQKLGEVHQTLALLKRIMGGSGVDDFGGGSAGKGRSKEGSQVIVRDVRVDEGEVRKLVAAWCAESSTGFVRCVEGVLQA